MPALLLEDNSDLKQVPTLLLRPGRRKRDLPRLKHFVVQLEKLLKLLLLMVDQLTILGVLEIVVRVHQPIKQLNAIRLCRTRPGEVCALKK